MKRLYKRLVTVGMITITSVFAWIYCILEYRKEAAYVICASLLVVVSLYVLLLTYISLKDDREAKLRNEIRETIAENLLKTHKNDDQEDVLRLLKAMYVQIRKYNEAAENEMVAATVNKAMKVIVKYNQSNNDALLASIATLSAELEAIRVRLEAMNVTTAAQPSDEKEDAAADVILFPSAQAEDFEPDPSTFANPE